MSKKKTETPKEECGSCNGTGEVYCEQYSNHELVEKGMTPCLYIAETKEQAWELLAQNLAQQMRCKVDEHFNPDDPHAEKCRGCAYERGMILGIIWHYANMPQ